MFCKLIIQTIPSKYTKYVHCIMYNLYSVMQSDRNSSEHKPTTYEIHVKTSSERIISFARYDYRRAGVFRIKLRPLVQKFGLSKSVNFPTVPI